MHKKILAFLLVVVITFSLTACKPSESLTQSNDDNSLNFIKYDSDSTSSNKNDVEVPPNYVLIKDDIYAVLDDNNEIISYEKIVFDATLGKNVFKPCDADGNISSDPIPTEPTTEETVAKPKSVTLNKEKVSLEVDKSVTLKVTTTPADYKANDIKWTSSNDKIAIVKDGKVTAKTAGTVKINVIVDDITATCTVTVNKKVESKPETKPNPKPEPDPEPTPKPKPQTISVTSVSISKTSATIYVGDSYTLYASANPSNASNKSITWSSSNSKTATVYNGVVTGKKAGTVTIYATSNNGKKASCSITVKNKTVATTGVTLNQKTAVMNAGKTLRLYATITPSNATNKKITWSSSDTSVATVNSSGTVTAKKRGTVTITAKTSGGQKATCTITVKPEEFKWTILRLSDCPLSVQNAFGRYIESPGPTKIGFSNSTDTYVIVKAPNGQNASIKSITEANGKITVKYSDTGSSNYVIARYNRNNTKITYVK